MNSCFNTIKGLSGLLIWLSSVEIFWVGQIPSAVGQWSAQRPASLPLWQQHPSLGTSLGSIGSTGIRELPSEVPEAPLAPPIPASEHVLSDQGRELAGNRSSHGDFQSGILWHQEQRHGVEPQADAPVFPEKLQRECSPFIAPWPIPSHPVAPEQEEPEEDKGPVRLGGKPLRLEESFPISPWQGNSSVPVRSLQLERIARQAELHIRRAFDLAGRGAYFSARSEFLTALELLAQGLDQQYQTQRHRRALAQAFAALEEAEDFLPPSIGGGTIRDVAMIVVAHQTPVLQGHSLERLTPMEALERYFTYAQEQLALAVGQEAAGSMALHGLGKLYAAMGEHPSLGLKAAHSKAMVFYQAALLVDPANYMAANDLGVLLARSGWYEEARAALTYSLRIQSHPVGWRNLAIVYRQMGQYELALQAAWQWRRVRQQEATLPQEAFSGEVVVQWVPPERFAAGQADGLTTPTSRADVSPGGPDNHHSKPSNNAPFGAKQSDFSSRSAWPEKRSPSDATETNPGPIQSSLLRGPLALFRQILSGEQPGDDSDRRPSPPTKPTAPRAANRPDPSASRRGGF